jgi:hypothetical protein
MNGKLTPTQRRQVFYRWILGNQARDRGERPETMAEIGARYGVTAAAVNYLVRSMCGDANRRPPGRTPRPCATKGCGRPARSGDLCHACRSRWRWRNDPEYRAKSLERGRRRAARVRAARISGHGVPFGGCSWKDGR